MASSELSEIATLQWLRPISSASVERNYSILTHMDIPTRHSMGRTSLELLLFLAGNATIVGNLLHAFADSVRRSRQAATGAAWRSARGRRRRPSRRGLPQPSRRAMRVQLQRQ